MISAREFLRSALQAATGLLAVVVLLIVMNWFFHKVYWTGWISAHNKRKEGNSLWSMRIPDEKAKLGLFWGMALLGFTSFLPQKDLRGRALPAKL